MSNIALKQYDGATVRPKDDAILYDVILNQSGIIYGCELTWKGNNVIHVGAGYGVIRGRMFEVTEHTIYAALPSASGSTYYGYVIIVLDLENADEPIKITSGAYSEAAVEGDWERDELVNHVNGIWEMPIAEYRATTTGITEFLNTAEKIEAPFVVIKDFSELSALGKEGFLVDASLIKKMQLTFENVTVSVDSFEETTDYTDFPYRGKITCSGVDENYVPYVTFGVDEAVSGNFAPIAKTATDVVYIYAVYLPENDFTVPTVQCIRKVG